MLKLNPITGLLDLVDSSGGGADPFPQYLLLAGRTGTTNNPIISLDADGTITGSAVPGKTLHILSEAGTAGAHLDKNAFGKARLLVGEQFDPFSAFVPGGILELAAVGEGGIGTLFGGFHAGSSGGVAFFGVSSQGTIAAPTASLDEDSLFKIAAFGYDSTDSLAGNEVGSIFVSCKTGGGPPTSVGFVAGQMVFTTTDLTGTSAVRIEIHETGTVTFSPVSQSFGASVVGDAELSDRATADEPTGARHAIWFNTDTDTFRGRIATNVTFLTDDGSGNVTVPGKLTVGGLIDPTMVLLSGGDKRFGATDAGTVYLAPFTDSLTAVQVKKADNTTPVAIFDTTFRRLAIGVDSTISYTFEAASDSAASIAATTYNPSGAVVAALSMNHARGTQALPTATQSGDRLGELRFCGYDGADFDSIGAGFRGVAAETVTAGTGGTNLDVLTTPIGSTTAAVRGRWHDDGEFGVGTTTKTGAKLTVAGNVNLSTAGSKHLIKEGTNASMGVSTLVGGAVVVGNTLVTASSRIFMTGQNSSGTAGELTISARTAGTSFTITSLNILDTRSIAWMIVEPA